MSHDTVRMSDVWDGVESPTVSKTKPAALSRCSQRRDRGRCFQQFGTKLQSDEVKVEARGLNGSWRCAWVGNERGPALDSDYLGACFAEVAKRMPSGAKVSLSGSLNWCEMGASGRQPGRDWWHGLLRLYLDLSMSQLASSERWGNLRLLNVR